MSQPIISIILPNYNHAAFLEERLDSIFNQTYQNFEVLILDDASTDQSTRILEKYRNHPRVTHFIINEYNTGSPFLQWKKGLELAKGKFVWIAESDDSCELNFLETQLSLLDQNDLTVALTKTFDTEGIKKTIAHPAFAEEERTILSNSSLLYCPVLNVSAAVFKMIDIKKLRSATFLEYPIIGDRVFYYEFFQGKKLAYNASTVSYFRQEGTGLSNLDSKGLRYLVKYFKEHMRFLNYIQSEQSELEPSFMRAYINKFFNRVRDRLSRKEKLSFQYLKLYLYFRKKIKQWS